ncbi:threonine synthase [Acetohalobium arabaticum]|uniref:Threonine synthase n=1 Tax=Acetohalobium arabaticum (strain ATCC 49924 / DSM 5501 / Z-7288) TaxID=574087 RepID=D9QQ36_ACEAZ|nr:threonine synthase [Acetohalobium arabaticum]ADL12627.1 L-threonine synthase [Acetohalobium arabaticum DSM 5501]
MKYISTRGNYDKVDASEAIRLGMVPTGGLFVPEEIPTLSRETINSMQNSSYQEIVEKILDEFLTDYTEQELQEAVAKAYNCDNFSVEEITSLYKLDDNSHVLELWHGPTAAFKDLALQVMPYLLSQAIEKEETDKDILILVATSGDTGKAALEGFKNVDGIEIIVFYPEEGVSQVQKRQMVTTTGDNTAVVAVAGNFDDCQSSVKEIFGDQNFKEVIADKGYQLSSANSINWGRLVPQIIYYFAAYAELLNQKEIKPGEEINITVPTGNFGNILASYYAYRMGLPVNKFICASNDNKVLTDFFKTGVYDKNRDFKKTVSPSMDILISSNLERFLFEVTGHDAQKVTNWYQQLKEEGKFEVDEETKDRINEIFVGEYATEDETKETIQAVYQEHNYVIDPHTAVGVNVYNKYFNNYNDKTTTVIDATANPYKFGTTVLSAINDSVITDEMTEFDILEELNEETGVEIHSGLEGLANQEIKHELKCKVDGIRDIIQQVL